VERGANTSLEDVVGFSTSNWADLAHGLDAIARNAHTREPLEVGEAQDRGYAIMATALHRKPIHAAR
jgi:hypothetical protein